MFASRPAAELFVVHHFPKLDNRSLIIKSHRLLRSDTTKATSLPGPGFEVLGLHY